MHNKKSIAGGGGANSNIDNVYFSSQLTNIKVKTSIDLIILSLKETHFDTLITQLLKHYREDSDNYVHKGNFRRKKVFKNNTDRMSLFYQSKEYNVDFYIPRVLLYLHQPTKHMMDQLHSIFVGSGISPKITKLELAWDFYTEDVWSFKEWIEQHLFLKYQRKPSFTVGNTYYTNDLRGSVKGIRVYPRPINSARKEFVRLELELHRAKILSLGIDFPIQPHHLERDFRNYFEFKRFDFDMLYKYLSKKGRKLMAKINRKSPGFGQLVLRQIESRLSNVTDLTLMGKSEELRDKKRWGKNNSRFFKPIGRMNMLVQEAADKQRFGLL
jgi:hypothetical protein